MGISVSVGNPPTSAMPVRVKFTPSQPQGNGTFSFAPVVFLRAEEEDVD